MSFLLGLFQMIVRELLPFLRDIINAPDKAKDSVPIDPVLRKRLNDAVLFVAGSGVPLPGRTS